MTAIMDLMKTILTEQTQILVFVFIGIFALEMLTGCTNAAFLFSMMLQMPYLFYATIISVNCSEGISVLENIEEMGCPMPKFLKDILNREKKNTEDTIENETK